MEARYQLRQSPVSVDELPVHNLTDLTVEALDGLLKRLTRARRTGHPRGRLRLPSSSAGNSAS